MWKIIVYSLLFFSFSFGGCKKIKYKKRGLVQIKNFGENPGNLKMFLYQKNSPSSTQPMVVMLHGCSQNAGSAARLSQWNKLADKYGFSVLYPEQRMGNNVDKCFNWSNSKDYNKDSGENKSIKSMVDYAIANYNINPDSVFVTGLSAGGAMTTILCAVYPAYFKAGAVMSGGPYQSAENLGKSYPSMRGKVKKSAKEWGDLVRNQNNSYTGDYPRIAIFQGEKDWIVNKKNADQLVDQWTNVHNIDNAADSIIVDFNGSADITKFVYTTTNNATKVIRYQIEKMNHALAIDPGNAPQQGGKRSLFSKDKDFFSTYWAADFFGLVQ